MDPPKNKVSKIAIFILQKKRMVIFFYKVITPPQAICGLAARGYHTSPRKVGPGIDTKPSQGVMSGGPKE